jgi:GDPmannose 4,6-dehydratase
MKQLGIQGKMNKQEGGFTMLTKQKTAVITGASGQDAAYLAQLLLEKGYRVVGIRRRSSTDNLWRLRVLAILDNPNLHIVEGDITDLFSLINIFKKYKPEEVYNLAAMSHVGVSFDQPKLTWDVTAQGAINVVDAALLVNPKTKVYQASTSEMMGSHFELIGGDKIQTETTRMDGNSPYGCAKFAAHNYMRVLRESNNSFVCCGILYNHGSPLRGESFFERKVTKYVGELINFAHSTITRPDDVKFGDDHISYNGQVFPKLRLGDLSTSRDMGHSKDYVKAMWSMMQLDQPEDFIICTGVTFQMKDIVKEAFDCVGLDWEKYVVIDPKFFRPREVEYLRGDCTKAKEKLGWKSEYDLSMMIKEMVEHDIRWAAEGRHYG